MRVGIGCFVGVLLATTASAGETEDLVAVLTGTVVGLDGRPEEGAVVVSDLGGRAVTDEAGGYRLVVRISGEASELRLTAIAGGGTGRLASAQVALGSERTTPVDPLVLALGSSCAPRWLPTFGAQPGTDPILRALAVFDDGGGPDLYAAGTLLVAGGAAVRHIARWDGTRWSDVGGGVSGAGFLTVVQTLAVFDDGSGPALFAGGLFDEAGGVPVSRIARWDGTSWSDVGGGVGGNTGFGNTVQALAVFDDGTGPALFAAGEFMTAGGVDAVRIARWNGTTWAGLGSGLSTALVSGRAPAAAALLVHDDGTGPALYVGGNFKLAGGVGGKNGIARWDGTTWAGLGSGMDAPVYSLASFDDGSGVRLYAGGEMTSAGGAAVSRLARWDGTSWTDVGGGTGGTVWSLGAFDDGTGPALYAGGFLGTAGGIPVNGIARWDGASWADVGGGVLRPTGPSGIPPAAALAVHDDGRGPALFVAGNLASAGGLAANSIARWDGASWSTAGHGLDHSVLGLAVFDDGGGTALYAGGFLTDADGTPVQRLARWDGTSWADVGGGVTSSVLDSPQVAALAVHDDGGGPALYAGGAFDTAGGVPASHVARWDGTQWSALGAGVSGTAAAFGVNALLSHDDGGGPALYAGGFFTTAGGLPANRIARWDGLGWTPLGSGLDGGVACLASFDDGVGPELYAGGNFRQAGGLAANGIARWDGAAWHALGGIEGGVTAMVVHDDGGGPALYVGGRFPTANGSSAGRLARWRAGSWSLVDPDVTGTVTALASFDDGTGPGLYVSGSHGPLGRRGTARWDGTGWTTLGTQLSNLYGQHPTYALLGWDDGSGPALFAAGFAPDSGDTYLAKWGFPADVEPPVLACPQSVVVADALGSPSGEIVTFSVTASDCRDPAPSVVCVPPSGSFFPRGTTLVTCTATDQAGNQSVCQFPVTVTPKARRR